MKKEWSNGARSFSEDVWMSSPSMIIPCSIVGITVEAHINPIMEVNIMPWHLSYTILGDVTLTPSDYSIVVPLDTLLNVGGSQVLCY